VKLELISIETGTYPLDGILYAPASGEARQAAMFFHGNCHNFYMRAAATCVSSLIAIISMPGMRRRYRRRWRSGSARCAAADKSGGLTA
jgi:hypothetical protein